MALTKMGGQCPNWAVWRTDEQYGRPLCAGHLPQEDARRHDPRLPREGERRCVANTLDGERCRKWALVEARARGMCRRHAYPREHHSIRHGYYRRLPYFTDEQRAFIADLAQEGKPFAAELLLVR